MIWYGGGSHFSLILLEPEGSIFKCHLSMPIWKLDMRISSEFIKVSNKTQIFLSRECSILAYVALKNWIFLLQNKAEIFVQKSYQSRFLYLLEDLVQIFIFITSAPS